MIISNNLVAGVDYGTDSVRVVIVDAENGNELASAVENYPRWEKGKYCDPAKNQFRQHPLDYIEGLEAAFKAALANAPEGSAEKVRGISLDTTGSTPGPVDKEGTPLAMTPGFEENPNAMFVLWKDHTAVKEAEEINDKAKNWGGEDFTKYEGGIYSSEWFWSKILHILRVDPEVRGVAFSWVEHCDWIPALLTGETDPIELKRSRTAAGHKAMWHASWNGLPLEEFLVTVDPLLRGLRARLYKETYTADTPVGNLSPEWAERLGLSTDVIVGIGAFDAHYGAIGAEIKKNTLVKVMGTSTCDMIVTEMPAGGEHLVKGICGQVDGSIVPGLLGMEAGQSAFGDVYAWFRSLLMWPLVKLLGKSLALSPEFRENIIKKTYDELIPLMSEEAEKLPIDESGLIALDWMNGRRTPDANQRLKGAITGINLGSDPPRIFRALVEATAFGSKRIVERFEEEGTEIKEIIAIGGIPKKSSFTMQITSDVLNRPIKVVTSEQTCALGSAMAAATAAGLYPSIEAAQQAMGSGFEKTFEPIEANAQKYQILYEKYVMLGNFIENELM